MKLVKRPSYKQKLKSGGKPHNWTDAMYSLVNIGINTIPDGILTSSLKRGLKQRIGELYGQKVPLSNTPAASKLVKQALKTRLDKQLYNVASDIWQYLMDKKVSPRNAAAMMGNIMQESTLGRNSVQRGGDRAVGLFQMHTGQLQEYKDWLKNNKTGKYPEIDYILHVINDKDHYYTNNYRKEKSNATTPENIAYIKKTYGERERTGTLYLIDDLNKAWNDPNVSLDEITDLFTNTIERSGRPEYEKRKAYANDFYNHFYGVAQ